LPRVEIFAHNAGKVPREHQQQQYHHHPCPTSGLLLPTLGSEVMVADLLKPAPKLRALVVTMVACLMQSHVFRFAGKQGTLRRF
jgi:hypothetical protein